MNKFKIGVMIFCGFLAISFVSNILIETGIIDKPEIQKRQKRYQKEPDNHSTDLNYVQSLCAGGLISYFGAEKLDISGYNTKIIPRSANKSRVEMDFNMVPEEQQHGPLVVICEIMADGFLLSIKIKSAKPGVELMNLYPNKLYTLEVTKLVREILNFPPLPKQSFE